MIHQCRYIHCDKDIALRGEGTLIDREAMHMVRLSMEMSTPLSQLF